MVLYYLNINTWNISYYRVDNSDETLSVIKEAATRKKSKTSGPLLSLLAVYDNRQAECQLENNKHKTVTFRFTIDDVVPYDVANQLVNHLLLKYTCVHLIHFLYIAPTTYP